MVRAPPSASSSPPPTLLTITEILRDQAVLVTGGAGFIGSALLYRLIAPDLALRRVFTIIRGKNPISRLPADLHPFVATVGPDGKLNDGPLVVLAGDCFLPGFGLSEQERRWLDDVDIVIHPAGCTKFTMPLPQAVRSISDLAYSMCQFSFGSRKVRTHMHLSTCFTGWFLPSGSTVHEELVPTLDPDFLYEYHANTYLHAKTLAEGVVNAIGRPQAGRPASKTQWRILRLSTIGPAASFPSPGWGAGHTSSPVCGAIAAQVVDESLYLHDAELDTVPVDIAVNQIIALTAATHASRRNPVPLRYGANVPIYHIAAGLPPHAAIPMHLLNDPRTKLARPYIPAKNLLAAYRPMVTKLVKFDTARTRHVLGLPPVPGVKLGKGAVCGETNGYGYTNGAEPTRDVAFDVTAASTDVPVDTAGFPVDVEGAAAQCGGWMRYLQVIRDEMERMDEPDTFEAHVD